MNHPHSFRYGHRLVALSLLVAGSALATGCQRSAAEPATPTPPAAATPAAAADPHAGLNLNRHAYGNPAAPSAEGGLAWDDPAGWVRERPASPMRRAQYRIPRAAGEQHDGELTVITFGPGQGGDTESNLERWYGQVTQPDGRATREVATRREMNVGAFRVTIAEAAGRLGGGGMVMPGLPPAPAIERGRLLAAIVDTPHGPWFFKLTGPDQTVAGARPAFETMLRSLRLTTPANAAPAAPAAPTPTP
jgi:hypothetical protein